MAELGDGNPAKVLLEAMRKHGRTGNGSFKDDYFYLGAFRGDKASSFPAAVVPYQLSVASDKPNVSYHIW